MSVEFALMTPGDLAFVRVRDCFKDTLQTLIEAPETEVTKVCNEYTWTAWGPYGNALACCGILDNGYAWALVDPDAPLGTVLKVHRKVREVLRKHLLQKGPVFANVNRKIPPAIRWAESLGFTRAGIGSTWIYR